MEVQTPPVNPKQKIKCYHCGEDCEDDSVSIEEKVFCCEGCRTVFEILSENDLCDYYALEQTPGISLKEKESGKYAYLDDETIISKLIDFRDNQITKVTLSIPQIHCASCIWLLENLYKVNPGVKEARANFMKKTLAVTFFNESLTLRKLVELLVSLGYEPEINLASVENKVERRNNKRLYYRLGIAGFCFGNIMLLSFPGYLGFDKIEPQYSYFFSYLNLVLALPVFFYSSSDYFISAYKGLKHKMLNIDVPVALGIFTLFARSVYEILTQTGPGFLDSMTGLVFFLLIGKWFQNKTYERLSFERDYKSYFPVSVIRKEGSKAISIPVSKLEVGDNIVIRKGELVPADSVLLAGDADIDYSFVTGESLPVAVKNGETVFAGGRQMRGAIEMEVRKKTSRSYLTQLWENETFSQNDHPTLGSLVDRVSQYFTPIVLLIAIAVGVYWLTVDSGKALSVFSAVLIVACPCALALATPFTLGNVLRIYGRNRFYVKNTAVVEHLAHIGEVVFDKTGTITLSVEQHIDFEGELNNYEVQLVQSLTYQSMHPLSRQIFQSLSNREPLEVKNFQEYTGKGIEGTVDGNHIKLGTAEFTHARLTGEKEFSTKSWLSIDGKLKGFYNFSNKYRENLEEVVDSLNKAYNLSLVSGDSEGERERLSKLIPSENLHFNQSPKDKLNFVKSLQEKGKRVMMIGDGLNDAGALKQSDVGIAVSENTNNFFPSCDAILDATSFKKLPALIRFSKKSVYVVIAAFAISFLYNFFGLFYAVQGFLSPMLAAILMPLSSITVVLFGTLTTTGIAWKNNLLTSDKSHYNY